MNTRRMQLQLGITKIIQCDVLCLEVSKHVA